MIAPSLLDLRWEGARGHVESWFLKANDPERPRAVWLKITVFARAASADPDAAPVPPVAEAWAVAFDREKGHVATKSTVPFSEGRFAKGTLDVEVDGCSLSLGRAAGALANGGRSLAWDLAIGAERAAPIVHLPHALYGWARRAFPSAKLVTPLADVRIDGRVEVRRSAGAPVETWDVRGWPAMVGHNWGRAHAHLYAWAHCNQWDDADDLVFEGVSARVRMGPMLSPMATAVYVRHRGTSYDLARGEILGTNRGTISLRRWEADASARGVRVRADLGAETDDFVGLHYANPRGGTTYCLNTKLARARLELRLPDGREVIAHSRAAALEIGTRDPHHGVRMYL